MMNKLQQVFRIVGQQLSGRSVRRGLFLLVLLLTSVLTIQASDWILDDGYFKATSYSDHVRFEVLLCDLYGKNTYSKGGYIYATDDAAGIHNRLIYLEYAYNSDDKDSNPTAQVKAYIVHGGG